MKKYSTLLVLSLIPFVTSGCVATQLEKLRKKIPSGHAGTLNAKVTTAGGWGGTIAGKNIDSDGHGHLSADEYSEVVNSPWASYSIDLTEAAIGKKKLEIKPATEDNK